MVRFLKSSGMKIWDHGSPSPWAGVGMTLTITNLSLGLVELSMEVGARWRAKSRRNPSTIFESSCTQTDKQIKTQSHTTKLLAGLPWI